jgi:hypothetical protein
MTPWVIPSEPDTVWESPADEQECDPDELAAAKGLLFAIAVCLPGWAAIVLLVLAVLQ